MTKQQFFKGLFMLLFGIIVSQIGQTPIDWAFMGIAVVAALLPYLGKNFFLVFLTSQTGPEGVSWQNVVSGVIIAVGTGLTEYFGQIVINHAIVWPVLWHTVIGITLTYITTTFFSPPNNQSPKLIKS
jgi:hypothetical protein